MTACHHTEAETDSRTTTVLTGAAALAIIRFNSPAVASHVVSSPRRRPRRGLKGLGEQRSGKTLGRRGEPRGLHRHTGADVIARAVVGCHHERQALATQPPGSVIRSGIAVPRRTKPVHGYVFSCRGTSATPSPGDRGGRLTTGFRARRRSRRHGHHVVHIDVAER
jgi:hypothetical protein